jgi:murein DD-endopeptidase MepM/ murein hydrolase activator NlpD
MAAGRSRSGRRAHSPRTVGLACAALLAAAFFGVALSVSGGARAAGVNRLTQGISSGQARVGALAGSVHAQSQQIGVLGGSIATLQRRLTGIQAKLYGQIAQLRRVQTEYQAAHAHLLRLERYESYAEGVLRRQLVGAYESPAPSLVTVILEAKGFPDLLDKLRFVRTIRQADARLVAAVRAARRTVAAQATRLGALQLREQALTTQILGERNALARAQIALLQRRDGLLRARGVTATRLGGARAHLAGLRTELARLQAAAAQRAAAQRAAGQTAPSSGSPAATPTPSGPPVSSGGFTFPLPTSAASPPGSWSLDQGVDISAPGGTPEYAVCSGTIVLHGIGGFGPWAPVLHCDSPIDGYSYVYYGHAGPANQLPVGTHVGAGGVMSEVGPGIVGISSGPHVEMGFSDASGTPVGGGSASTMESLLRAAYGG